MSFEAGPLPTPPPPLPEGARPDRAFLLLFGLAILAAMAFVLGVALGCRGNDVVILALAMLTFLLAAVPLAIDQGRPYPERHIFISLLAVVFIMYFGIPALVIYIPAKGPIDASGLATSAVTSRDVIYGQFVVLVALVTLLVTYSLPHGRAMARRLPTPVYDWPARTSFLIALGMMLMGWTMHTARAVGLIPAELGSGVIGTIAGAEVYANVLLTFVVLRHRSRLAVAVIVVNCVFSALVGLVTSGKERMLIAPAMVVVTWILMTRRIRATWVIAGLLAIILIYPASQFVRLSRAQGYGVGHLVSNPGETILAVVDFVTNSDPRVYFLEGFQSTATRIDGLGVVSVIARDTPSMSPYQKGWTLGLFFVAFIPRVLWPEKPNIQLGKWIANTYGAGRGIEAESYFAPTQIGEYYLNFGLIGVIGGMFLIGTIVRITQESLLRGPGTAPSILAASVLLYLLTRKFQGSVAGTYSQIVFTLTPILMTHVAFRFLGHVVYTGPPRPVRPAYGGYGAQDAESSLETPV